MQVNLDITNDLAKHFAGDSNGLARAALEAVEGVRSRELTASQARLRRLAANTVLI